MSTELLAQALRDIIDPIAYIERNMEEGCRLDGHAALQQISSREFYVRLAREAIAAHEALAAAPAEPVAFVHWPLNGPPKLVWYSNKAMESAILKAYEGHQPDLLLYTHPAPQPQQAGVAEREPLVDILGNALQGLTDAYSKRRPLREVPDLWTAAFEALTAYLIAKRAATPPQAPAPAPQAQAVRDDAFLQADDYHLLHRFIETLEDGEGYDIGKEAIKRLADLGVVQSSGFGRYGVTMFGYWVHERYWHQNPSLPLRTNSDRDAAKRSALASAAQKEPT